jgi:hypothetical protein
MNMTQNKIFSQGGVKVTEKNVWNSERANDRRTEEFP